MAAQVHDSIERTPEGYATRVTAEAAALDYGLP